MPWPTPIFSRNQVNRSGKTLRSDISTSFDFDRWFEALEVLGNWRSCHGYPINTFQATLREKLKRIDQNAIVVQRLKRTPSIISKLIRFPQMQLATMQDIGGLRAVVSNLRNVRALESSYKRSRFHHELVNQRDYIQKPKRSGYRSIHLVYRYQNPAAPKYNGLFLELQIRSRLQHAWATAVETMGTFLDESLKASEGSDAWLDFFSLTGAGFAHLERCPPVPGYEAMSKQEIYEAIVAKTRELKVHDKLRAFTVAVDAIHSDKLLGSYYLVVLDPVKMTVRVQSFGKQRLEEANRAYVDVEKRIAKGAADQAVLVSASSIDSLRRAYPNYFLDSDQFLKKLSRIEEAARTAVNKRRGRTAKRRR